MRIVYVGLEPYPDRYTLQLTEWNIREFKRLDIDYFIVDGNDIGQVPYSFIRTGAVLDAHQRILHATTQIQNLVIMASNNELDADDFIFFEDMFHPGIESLAYVFMQQWPNKADRPKIGMRCLAQTIDPDDFVHYAGLAKWMRHYEAMVNSFVDVIFAASEEMLPFMTAAGWDIPVVVTGLPFGKQEVIERLGEPVMSWINKFTRVVFASRIADEKQVEFFLAVAENLKNSDIEFAFVSGGKIKHPQIDRAVLTNKNIHVYPLNTKQEYYKILNNSKVLFNCALQDWVSNTVSEGDTFGCNLVYPAYRSFSEVFENDNARLYIPWSLRDATAKVFNAVRGVSYPKTGQISDYQNKTIKRTVEAMQEFMKNPKTSLAINTQDTSYRKRITNAALERF